MGLTFVIATVANTADIKKRKEVEFMVDSGAVYSIVPRTILKELDIVPHSKRTFILANGEKVERELGTAAFEYQERRGDSLVIFGEPDDVPLLGATTLEGFALILDPFRRELKPLPMVLG